MFLDCYATTSHVNIVFRLLGLSQAWERSPSAAMCPRMGPTEQAVHEPRLYVAVGAVGQRRQSTPLVSAISRDAARRYFFRYPPASISSGKT